MAFDKNSYGNEFKRQNYDRVTVLLPKGKAKTLKDEAATREKSTSQFIVEAIEHCYKLDLSKKDGG